MSDNPYQVTKSIDYSIEHGANDPKLDRTLSMLRQTKPWVRFISVMTFVGSAFMVIGGGLMMVGAAGGGIRGVSAFVGIVYLAMALLYIIPGVFLWNYADRIGVFMNSRTTGALASALESQKSFWKFVGIMMVIVMGIYGLIFVVAIGSFLIR